jgi:AcrR family transcriptional regulator
MKGVDKLVKHVPQETRRIETKRKITDAAILLFASQGYYKTTSKHVAKAAGVSIGSFYTYFVDKKALLIDILNTYIEEAMPAQSASPLTGPINSADKKTFLRNVISQLFKSHHFTEGFYYQVAMLSRIDAEIGKVFKEYQEKSHARIKDILLYYVPNLEADRLDVMAIIVYSAIEGSIHAVKFADAGIDESLLQEELLGFFDSYLID